jgi:hypothetical protein
MLFWSPHPDTGVRLLAIRCYALQSGMSEAEREKLETEVLGAIWEVDCQICCGEDLDGKTQEMDGWLLPALESKRVIDARNAILQDHQEHYFSEGSDESQTINMADLRQVYTSFLHVRDSNFIPQPFTGQHLWHLPVAFTRAIRNLIGNCPYTHGCTIPTFARVSPFTALACTPNLSSVIWEIIITIPFRRLSA